MNENTWVDFQAVKAAVSMQMVLDRYGINCLRKSGDNFVGRCPIHNGEGERTLSVSLVKNAFRCFSCKAKGNVLDFVAAMEHCSIRDAALKLKDWFVLGGAVDASPRSVDQATRKLFTKKIGEQPEPNKLLAFALKEIDPSHPYLKERGMTEATAAEFSLGFFSGKGSMSGRIVIPIHNAVGELIAYAGRSLDCSEPKYKLPAGFHKSQELFNFHRAVKAESRGGRVIVVEGFFDCINVHQAGFPGVVALMGCELSEAQAVLLSEFYEIVLMLDGDDAGRTGTAHAADRLARVGWVRIVDVPKNHQPDQCSVHEIQMLLGGL